MGRRIEGTLGLCPWDEGADQPDVHGSMQWPMGCNSACYFDDLDRDSPNVSRDCALEHTSEKKS